MLKEDIINYPPMTKDEEIEAIGICLTPEVGNTNDGVCNARIVFDKQENLTVYAHVLTHKEPIPNKKVKVPAGNQLVISGIRYLQTIEGLDMSLSLTSIDGYKTLTNVFLTRSFFENYKSNTAYLYLLTTARRLDTSHKLVESLREDLDTLKNETNFYRLRRLSIDIIGKVEIAVIAINRALQMTVSIPKEFSVSSSPSSFLVKKSNTVRKLRNAYEHIEDRTKGKIYGKPHKDALSIFNHTSLYNKRIIQHGKLKLEIDKDLTQLFIESREYLKKVAIELL